MKTNTMVLTRFNEPLVPEEIEIPALRPGEILIKLEASGICGSDVHMWKGEDPRTPLPIILGHEGVGRIAAMNGVHHTVDGKPLHEGDRVLWNRGVTCGECFACKVLLKPWLCENRKVYGINRAREMMRRHIGDNLPPEEIARRLNIGYTWFRRTFRAYVGIAPAQYQLQLRHNKARELLTTTDRTVSEIAAELGFENVSQFSAFFRQREKITATQYRSKYGF